MWSVNQIHSIVVKMAAAFTGVERNNLNRDKSVGSVVLSIVIMWLSGCQLHGVPDANLTHIAYNPLKDELLVLRTLPSGNQSTYALYANDVVSGAYTLLTTLDHSGNWPMHAFAAAPTGSAMDVSNNQLLIMVPPIGLIGIDLGTYHSRIISDMGDLNLGPIFADYADIVVDDKNQRVIAVTNDTTERTAVRHQVLSISLQTGLRELLADSPPVLETGVDTSPALPGVYCCDDIEIVDDEIFIISRNLFYSIKAVTGSYTVIRDDLPSNIRIAAIPGQSQLLFINVLNHSLSTYDLITRSWVENFPPIPKSRDVPVLRGVSTHLHPTGRVAFAANNDLYVIAPYTTTVDYLHKVDLLQGTVHLHDVDYFNRVEASGSGL